VGLKVLLHGDEQEMEHDISDHGLDTNGSFTGYCCLYSVDEQGYKGDFFLRGRNVSIG
jgi:hypothetical protein